MTTATLTPSMADRYIEPLINLSDNIKLEIINRLSASMLHIRFKESKATENVDLYSCFEGDWGKGQSTEDYCRELRTEALVEDEEIATW